MRLVYSCLWYLALPLVFARLLWRARRNRGYLRAWRERLGYIPKPRAAAPIWVHAVSVGETVAAAPLIEALLTHEGPDSVLVTSTTPTGAERVKRLFGDRVDHGFIPFDMPGAVARFFARARPRLGIIMETEIWPNLFHACAKRHIPLILANARLSARSAKGYRRAGGIIRDSLDAVTFVAAQSSIDAQRFRTLGVDDNRVVVAGNLKYEINLPPDIHQHAQALRAELGDAPIWLAASTHDGEEAMVLDAFSDARRHCPTLRLLLVPRHPERFDRVASLCTAHGLRVSRRSQRWPDATGADVLLGDSMGELLLFYAVADLAFVGGSLVPVGGHNILEAAALDCPIIIGPHTFNMEGLRADFEDAVIAVKDAHSLSHAVTQLVQCEDNRVSLARRAAQLLDARRGSVDTLEQLIKKAQEPTVAAP